MALQYNGSKIYDEGNEGNTYTLTNIYDVSVAGGWNMVEQPVAGTFIVKCPIYIEGNNNLKIGYGTYENLIFDYASSDYVYAIYFNSTGYLRIGFHSITNYSNNTSAVIDGYRITNTSNRRMFLKGDVIIANSMLKNFYYFYVNGNDEETKALITKCLANFILFGISINNYTEVYDSLITTGSYGLSSFPVNNVIENVLISDCNIGLLIIPIGTLAIFKNIKLQRCSSGKATYFRCANYDSDVTINYIDCQINKNELAYYISGSKTQLLNHIQNLQGTYNFIISAIENVEIKLYNNLDELIFNGYTDVNGELTTEQTYYSYNVITENAALKEEVRIDLEPFKLVVSKAGYETEAIENITVTPGIPTTLNVTLKKAIEAMVTNRGLAIKANKENYGNDRDFALIP